MLLNSLAVWKGKNIALLNKLRIQFLFLGKNWDCSKVEYKSVGLHLEICLSVVEICVKIE